MLPALVGGVLIGLAASVLWLGNGRIAGVSGMVAGALRPQDGKRDERLAFLFGLFVVGCLAGGRAASAAPLGVLVVAGLLVGFGTRLGSGCTSGHGVCGISRFSARSIVATLTFMATAAATVFVVTHFFPALQVAP